METDDPPARSEDNLNHIAALTMIALPDHCKILLLLATIAACLSTLWTTTSFELGSQNVPQLMPKTEHWCYHTKSRMRSCQQGKASCSKEEKEFMNCQSAIKKAYRFINMGGCVYENNAHFLCRQEWCDPAAQIVDQKQCERECGGLKTALEVCIQKIVAEFLTSHHVNRGTDEKVKLMRDGP